MNKKMGILVLLLLIVTTSCYSPEKPKVIIPPAPTATFTLQPVYPAMDEEDAIYPTEIVDEVEEYNGDILIPKQDPDVTSVPIPDTPIVITMAVPGVEMHHITNSGGLEMVRDSGANWVRRNALFWSQVEPSPGERRWDALVNLDIELINASEAGLETILIVRSTPRWAQKIPWDYCGPVAQEAIEAFANFMYELVERYSVPPYNVLHWEIGNEPDVDPKYVKGNEIYGCWGDENEPFYGGEYYAQVLKKVYPKVKEANSQAQLLIGGLLLECDPRNPPLRQGSTQRKDCSQANFLEGILKQGGADYFDGVSFHAYDYYWGKEGDYRNPNWHSTSKDNGPVLIVKAEFIRETLTKYNITDKYLMNTESGILCGSTGEESFCRTEAFRNTKAYYVAQSHAAAQANGLKANIWYSIYGWRGSGLALTSNTPTTALTTFQVSAEMLEGSAFVRNISEFPDLMGYVFSKNGRNWWIIWSKDGETHQIQLIEKPEKILDVYGTELVTQRDLNISSEPVYLVFP